jgi:antitoxin component of RelBE/YafQ-DinJ toxin-antitoxin module
MKLTRNKQINLRISEKDKDRLQAEAEALNLTLSTYIIIQLNQCNG